MVFTRFSEFVQGMGTIQEIGAKGGSFVKLFSTTESEVSLNVGFLFFFFLSVYLSTGRRLRLGRSVKHHHRFGVRRNQVQRRFLSSSCPARQTRRGVVLFYLTISVGRRVTAATHTFVRLQRHIITPRSKLLSTNSPETISRSN